MKPITIKGKDTNEKFNHVERILQRFSRRLHKTVIGLIPASPIFGYCESSVEDSMVLRAIFPADGVITHAAIRADKCEKGSHVHVNIVSDDEDFTKSFALRPKAIVREVNFSVKAGDSMEIWISDPDSENDGSFGVLVGLLYQVGMKDLASTKLLIDQFDKLIDDQPED